MEAAAESAIEIWRRLEAKGARVRYRPVTREEIEVAASTASAAAQIEGSWDEYGG